NSNISSLGENEVKFSSGETLKAHCIVDARGWKKSESIPSGYQKFVGLDIKLKRPHGLKGVRLKDVRVEQIDGYRFVYILPWNEDEVLVEDTYYSNSSELNTHDIRNRILSYVEREGWEVEAILREESGCLPLTSSFEIPKDNGPVKLGARSGEYQPVTGYTFPQTFHRIHVLLSLKEMSTEVWKQKLNQIQRQDKKQRAYFHFLNKLLFQAASPEKRYLILEHFYTLPALIIERFYQGRLSAKDKIRIFVGKPPVSIIQFLRVLVRECYRILGTY